MSLDRFRWETHVSDADIFLSYNRQDQPVAQLYAEALEKEGLSVWWDVTLRSGEAYDEVTEAALRAARAVIVLWSPRSVASRWVRAEATLAEKSGTLVPARIEPCELPIMFELTQTADLTHWKGHGADPKWRQFVTDVRRHIAGEVENDYEEPSAVQMVRGAPFALPDKPSIAVLPLTDLSGHDEDHFADGIVEEISTALGRFQTLFVIAGSSSLTYRDRDRDPAKICRELGVRYLLDGTVRRSGNRVRITVKLIDGIQGSQIWADKFDDSLDDIFDLQDRVAGAVAARIDSSIDTAELERVRSDPTVSSDIYDLYWRANAVFRKMDPASLSEAIALTAKVLEKDPRNAWAASLASFCHATLFANGVSEDPMATRQKALDLYKLALENGGSDVRVLGYCSASLVCAAGDPHEAMRLTQRALEINPGSPTNLFWGAWNDIIIGNADRAYERFEQALRLNPMSIVRPMTVTGMGTCRLFQRQYDEAADILLEASPHLPHFPATWAALTAALGHAGRRAEGRRAREHLRGLGDNWGALGLMSVPEQTNIIREGIELIEE